MRLVALVALLGLAACGRPRGPYAVLETSKGRMVARLYPDRAPKTISHLKALSDGTKPWKDPKTGQAVRRPLYDGTVFHRVVPGFMIQGGGPAGGGDPAVPVSDEFNGSKFDRPGLLGMASWGPGTSQTEFFVTLGPAPELDGKYTLFGELVEGLEAARAIAASPRDIKNYDRPFAPPVLKSLRVVSKRP